jgi:cell division protein FtsW
MTTITAHTTETVDRMTTTTEVVRHGDDNGSRSSSTEYAPPYDRGLLIAVLMLVGFGVVMVYSASVGVADMRHGDPTLFLRNHLLHAALAIMALAVGMSLDYRAYRHYVYWILGVSILLLFLLVIGFGATINNSTRWIGPEGLRFQPSELAKLAFVFYLAYSLEKKHEQMRSFTIGFLPHLIVCCIIMLLCLAQPDLGTCVLLGLVMFVMLFVGGTRVSYIVAMLFVSIPMTASYIANSSFRMKRILAWLDPWQDRADSGYQTVNALTSLGSGEWFGLGLGNGRQKMGFVPESWTDFIYASIGEELGFVGVAAVALLFLFLFWRGYRITTQSKDNYGRHLAFGITAMLSIQAAFNMGVAVGLLPTKGLTLPFVSGGGSSLITCCFAVGVLLNISRGRSAPRKWQRRRLPRVPRNLDPTTKSLRPKSRRPIKQRDSGVRAFVAPEVTRS